MGKLDGEQSQTYSPNDMVHGSPCELLIHENAWNKKSLVTHEATNLQKENSNASLMQDPARLVFGVHFL